MFPRRRLKSPLRAPTACGGNDGQGVGVLQPHAAKVLMKLLYGARLARFDLLRAINHLAGYITKWTPDCDKRLHRIMCYVHTSLHYRMIGWVGDKPDQLEPHLFADADFAGCPDSQRSTSGLHLAIRGPANSWRLQTANLCVALDTRGRNSCRRLCLKNGRPTRFTTLGYVIRTRCDLGVPRGQPGHDSSVLNG